MLKEFSKDEQLFILNNFILEFLMARVRYEAECLTRRGWKSSFF